MEELTRAELEKLCKDRAVQIWELKETLKKRTDTGYELMKQVQEQSELISQLKIENAILKKSITDQEQEQAIKDRVEIANQLFNICVID